MRGRQHLAITLATTLGLITPFYHTKPVLSVALVMGAVIGSLIPDIDSSDALIFHKDVLLSQKGYARVFNLFPGVLLPFFGYITKYAVYIPSVLVFKIILPGRFRPSYGHRKYMHSLLGITVTTLITGIYAVIGLNLVDPIEINSLVVLAVFLTGYLFGAVLHLLEDACTKTGIMFLYPFSTKTIKGNIITGKDQIKPFTLTMALITSAMTGLYLSTTSDQANALYTVLGLNTASWIFFMAFIADIKISN